MADTTRDLRAAVRRGSWAALAIAMLAASASAKTLDPALKALIDGPQRSDKNRLRDRDRHPADVLAFFGVKPDSVVVEILPGASGYRDRDSRAVCQGEGALHRGERRAGDGLGRGEKGECRLRGEARRRPDRFRQSGNHAIRRRPPRDRAGRQRGLRADVRNVHNWMAKGEIPAVFRPFTRP